MGAISGQYGSVKIGTTTVSEVNGWSVNKQTQIFSTASADTPSGRGMQRVAGRANHVGTMKGLFDPAAPPAIEDGSTYTLKLYVNETKYYQVSAIVGQFAIPNVDIENGAIVEWNATFEIIGELGSLQTAT